MHYLRRHEQILENWQSRFSKYNTAPQHVNNSTDPHEIAEKFCQHYAADSFDSYADLNSITKLNVQLLDMPQYCSNDFSVTQNKPGIT